MSPLLPTWPQPSHPHLLKVTKSPTAYASGAVSLVALPPGAHFTHITTATATDRRTYSTVQTSRDAHVELNCDLLYCNHSCAPSLEFDMARFEVRVARHRPLAVGDHLTFFYPSTEWEMAQPFRCTCGAPGGSCKGWIAGAARMDAASLREYWLNDHIVARLAEK